MRSTLSTSFGRWQQRRGLSLSVLQQLVSLESYRWCSGSRQPWGEVVPERPPCREISVTTRWTSGQCVAWPPCRPWLTTVHSSHAVIKSASSTVVYTADSVFRTAIGGFSNFDRRRCGSLQACWSSAVQSGQQLRGPHIAQQQLSIDICCPRRISAANPPAAAAAVDLRDWQTDGRALDRFMALTEHYADRVINIAVCSQLEGCTRDWQVRLSALPNPSIAAVPAIDRSSIPDKSKKRRSTYSNNTAGAQVGGVGWLVNTR